MADPSLLSRLLRRTPVGPPPVPAHFIDRTTAPTITTLTTLVVLAFLLYVAREIFIPIALATFIGLLLNPVILRLQRMGSRRTPAVVVVVVAAMAPVVGVTWIVVRQFLRVITSLPDYSGNITKKLETLRGPAGRGFGRLTELLRELQSHGTTAVVVEKPPLAVSVVDSPGTALDNFSHYLLPVLHPFALIGITLVFVIFILVQWDDLRDRLIRLFSVGRLTTTTSALDELSDRISRFLRTQFLFNCAVGLVVGLALYFLEVDNAFLWGFLAGALRYIPYLGAIVAGLLPVVLSIATSDGWAQPLKAIAFFVVFEGINNNFVEPYLYGTSTGVTSIAMLLAALFWGWLWGIPGLLLATPLTVCLVVASRHVPQLSFIHTLLGDQPSLDPPAKLYQRLVAMDADQPSVVAGEFLKGHSLAALYDDLLLPALRNADREAEEGALDAAHHQFVLQTVAEIIEDSARPPESSVAGSDTPPAPYPASPAQDPNALPALRVLCIPARDEADALGALMVEMLAPTMGIAARALSVDDLGTDLTAIAAEFRPDVILVSGVPPHASTHARARAKLSRRRVPHVPYLAGIWGIGAERASRSRLETAGFEAVVGSMAELSAYLRDLLPRAANNADLTPAPAASGPAPIPGSPVRPVPSS